MHAMSLPRVLLAAFAALLILPAGSSAANTWQPGPAFAEDATATPTLSVVGAGDGSTWAAWTALEPRPPGTASVVLAQRVGSDGTRGPLLRLGTTKPFPVGELKEDPGYAHISVVPTPTGAAVLWLDTKSQDPKVKVAALKLARLGAAGVTSVTTVDEAAQLATLSSLAPEVVSNPAGELLVSWWSAAGQPLVQKFTAADVPLPALALPQAGPIDAALRIALLDDGTARVAYRANNGLNVARLTAGGDIDRELDPDPTDDKPGPLAVRTISSDGRQLLSYASLATDGKQVRVTWAEDVPRGGNGSGPGTYRTASLPATGPAAAPAVFAASDAFVPDQDGNPGRLATGLATDGTLTMMRQPTSSSILITRLRPGAAPVDVTVAGGPDDPNEFNVRPTLAVSRDGTAVVAWTGIRSVANGVQSDPLPYAVVLAPDGTQGTRYTSASPGLASAAMLPSGPAIAVYDAQLTGGRILTRSWRPDAAPVEQPAVPGAAPAPSPAPAPAPTPAPATAPLLTGVKLSKTSFAAGTRVQFSLRSSEAGTATILVTRSTKGRRSGKTCKPQTKKNRKAKACSYDKVLRTLTAKVPAGSASIAFDGKAAGKALAAGTYKARITVTGASGLASEPSVVTFKVKKKRK